MPLSSFTLQERSERHIPPTFATPKVLLMEQQLLMLFSTQLIHD